VENIKNFDDKHHELAVNIRRTKTPFSRRKWRHFYNKF